MKSLDEHLHEQAAAVVDWEEVNKQTKKIAAHSVSKERWRQYHNQYRRTVEGRARSMLGVIRSRSKQKGYDYDLDVDWLIERLNQPCPRTGFTFVFETGGRNWCSPSIDRLDHLKGYTKDNCQVVVAMYNFCKNMFHDDQVLAFAKAVVETQHTKN